MARRASMHPAEWCCLERRSNLAATPAVIRYADLCQKHQAVLVGTSRSPTWWISSWRRAANFTAVSLAGLTLAARCRVVVHNAHDIDVRLSETCIWCGDRSIEVPPCLCFRSARDGESNRGLRQMWSESRLEGSAVQLNSSEHRRL